MEWLQALTGHHVGPTTAAAALEELFSSGGGGGRGGTSKRVTVLLVDEMDLLVTKKQTVGSLQGCIRLLLCGVLLAGLQRVVQLPGCSLSPSFE